MLKYLLRTQGPLNLVALVWDQEILWIKSLLLLTSWLPAAFHPQCYSSFQNIAEPEDSSVCPWTWQTLWDVLERLWKNPDIIADQSDTAESCFHCFLHRHKVKILALYPFSFYLGGDATLQTYHILPQVLPFPTSEPTHCCLSLSSCLVDHIISHSIPTKALSHSCAFMLPVKLPFSLCKVDTKAVFGNFSVLYICALTIFFASMVL